MDFTNSHEVEDQNEFSWFLKGSSLDDYLKNIENRNLDL